MNTMTLTETSLGSPAVAPIYGGPVAVVPQGQFLHFLQQITDTVNVGLGQLRALDVDLSVS